MATTAQSIVDKAQIVLQDITAVRWAETELLGWLNDACREVCSYKPDAYVVNETVQTTAGTKQTLPTGGLTLIDVTRNFDGTTVGNVIRQIDRRILDDQIPDWHSVTPTAAASHFCFDPRDQKTFYLYPPSDGDSTGGSETKVEIVYAKAPADVALGDNILIDDTYNGPIMDYILYRAYLKDADYAGDDTRAQVHYDRFIQALGGKEAGETSAEATAMLRRANRTTGQTATAQQGQ
jgi:hypothetical protein